MTKNESKILIFGGSGYIGNHMVKASIKLGHPTYVYSRPQSNHAQSLNEFQSLGVIIVKGELDDHDKLVSILRQVDVVICALAYPQVLDQLKIIQAIKVAGNIKLCLTTKKILASILSKWQLTDPRTCNRIVIYRPLANIISQLELISRWEKKTGRIFNKIHVPEQEIVTLSKTLPDPHNIPVSILHSVFVKGVTMNFDLGKDDIEASALYPDMKFTTVDELLDIFMSNPPKPGSAAFE